MTKRTYASPDAFKQALEQRLRASGSGPELARRRQLLVGIDPPTLRLCPVETHIAEKLHAYTMPRPRPNTRVKDLPDLALLASIGALEASRLAEAFEQTFTFRCRRRCPSQTSPGKRRTRPWRSPISSRGGRSPT